MDFFLRELNREDVPAINTWRNDPALIGMLGAAFRYVSEAVDHKWFEGYLANRANAVRLAICEQIHRPDWGGVSARYRLGASVGRIWLVDWGQSVSGSRRGAVCNLRDAGTCLPRFKPPSGAFDGACSQ